MPSSAKSSFLITKFFMRGWVNDVNRTNITSPMVRVSLSRSLHLFKLPSDFLACSYSFIMASFLLISWACLRGMPPEWETSASSAMISSGYRWKTSKIKDTRTCWRWQGKMGNTEWQGCAGDIRIPCPFFMHRKVAWLCLAAWVGCANFLPRFSTNFLWRFF